MSVPVQTLSTGAMSGLVAVQKPPLPSAPLLESVASHSTPAESEAFSWRDSQLLTQALSQKAYAKQEDILDLAKTLPRAQGVVGDLPPDWLQKIHHSEWDKQRSLICMAFKKTMQTIRDACHGKITLVRGLGAAVREKTKDHASEEPDVLDRDLAAGLKQAGIREGDQPVKFTFAGEGCLGSVHRFEVNDTPYALKLFKQKVNTLPGSIDLQGSPVEQNRAAFIQKNIPDSPFTRFYFGDLDAGYMVTEFVKDGPASREIRPVLPESFAKLGLVAGDITNPGNTKQGRIVDYGGIDIVDDEKSAK